MRLKYKRTLSVTLRTTQMLWAAKNMKLDNPTLHYEQQGEMENLHKKDWL